VVKKTYEGMLSLAVWIGIYWVSSAVLGDLSGAKLCFTFFLEQADQCDAGTTFHYVIIRIIIPLIIASIVSGFLFAKRTRR